MPSTPFPFRNKLMSKIKVYHNLLKSAPCKKFENLNLDWPLIFYPPESQLMLSQKKLPSKLRGFYSSYLVAHMRAMICL